MGSRHSAAGQQQRAPHLDTSIPPAGQTLRKTCCAGEGSSTRRAQICSGGGIRTRGDPIPPGSGVHQLCRATPLIPPRHNCYVSRLQRHAAKKQVCLGNRPPAAHLRFPGDWSISGHFPSTPNMPDKTVVESIKAPLPEPATLPCSVVQVPHHPKHKQHKCFRHTRPC